MKARFLPLALAQVLLLCTSACVVSRARGESTSPTDWQRATDAPRASQVTVALDRVTYPVDGASAEGLREAMNRMRPTDPSGRRHDAYTEWHVTWTYPHEQAGLGCRTGPVAVSVKIRQILPHWEAMQDASSEVVRHWQQYLDGLERHESGHMNLGIHAAEEVRRTLPGLPSRNTCENMSTAANAVGERILEKYRELERAYDRDTQHGLLQGAKFP